MGAARSAPHRCDRHGRDRHSAAHHRSRAEPCWTQDWYSRRLQYRQLQRTEAAGAGSLGRACCKYRGWRAEEGERGADQAWQGGTQAMSVPVNDLKSLAEWLANLGLEKLTSDLMTGGLETRWYDHETGEF